MEAAGELTSSGMREFLRILEDIIDSDFYRKIRQQTRRLQEEMSALRFVITYDKDRISVAIGELAGESLKLSPQICKILYRIYVRYSIT